MMAPERLDSTGGGAGQLPSGMDGAVQGAGALRPQMADLPAAGGSALDADSFAAAFEANRRVLWLVAVGIVADRSAAEDVVQESAVLALEKLSQFQPGSNFRAWMAQMVRFVALNHARRQQKHRQMGQHLMTQGAGELGGKYDPAAGRSLRLGPHGELPADQSHFDDRLLLALNSINEVARSCLLLRTIEQLEYAEISTILGIPEGTAMSHVHRTRQHLRERLADLAPAKVKQGGKP